MKPILILFSSVYFGVLISACTGSHKTAEQLLEDSKTENEIYSAILRDSTRLANLMDKMMEDEKCRKMITGNNAMMKMMCMSDKMDTLISNDSEVMENVSNLLIGKMKTDSAVCDKTCTRIIESDYLKKYLQHSIEKEKTQK